MRSLAIPLLAVVVALTGCSAAPPSAPEVDVPVGPEGDAFYRPPEPAADAAPGDPIWIRPIDGPEGSDGFAILYWSTAESGALVPVSGVLFRPTRTGEPEPPRTIVAWAEGTSGMGDDCAPSRDYVQGSGPAEQIAQAALELGGVFVASDYEGLGTPGDHPYIAQRAAGRNVLDSIRAAARIIGAGQSPYAVVLGRSQGGGAALFAAELQGEYAPELVLGGTVAIAPPSKLTELDVQLDGGPYFGYVLMAIAGLVAAYPELSAEAAGLTPAGRDAVERVRTMCGEDVLAEYAMQTGAAYGTGPVLRAPGFSRALAENDPGRQDTPVPILIVHGEQDDTIPVENSRDLVRAYCGHDVMVTAKFYPDQGHVDVLLAALRDIVTYLLDRLAGTPASASCDAY